MNGAEGFFISVIAGCMFLTSLYVGMIYYRIKDITTGKTKLVMEPRYFKIVLREGDIHKDYTPMETATYDTGVRER